MSGCSARSTKRASSASNRGRRDESVVCEMRPLALSLRVRLVGVTGVLAHLLEELDALPERRQIEEGGDLGCSNERGGLTEEEDGVEGGFELVGLAEGLDDLQEVLVGLHFLPREFGLERVVVCRCAILAVLDEERFAEVLLGELTLRDVKVEERELEVELLQERGGEVRLLLAALWCAKSVSSLDAEEGSENYAP